MGITDDTLVAMSDQLDGTSWFTLISAPGAGKRIKLYEIALANEYGGNPTVVEFRWGNSGNEFCKLGTPGSTTGTGGGGGAPRLNFRPGHFGPDNLALQARMRVDPGVVPPALTAMAIYQVF